MSLPMMWTRALVGGPEAVEIREVGVVRGVVAGEGDVVDQRVEPDVGDEVRIEGDLDAPAQAFLRAGDAEVGAGVSLERVEQLGFAERGEDGVGRGFEVVLEPLGVFAEFEIPVFLLDLDDLAPLGAEVAGLVAVAVGEELLLADRVVAGVGFLVELALVFEGGEDGLDAGLVAGVDGFRPAVVVGRRVSPRG